MTAQSSKDGVKGYECKHALYFTANDGSEHDVLVIKEYKHYHDGRREPYLRLIVDYERPFWVTHASHRKHKDKKEWEKRIKLQEFKSTQIQMPRKVAHALGRGPSRDGMRSLTSSPYLYGCDADTPLLAKRRYMDTYPDCISDNLVAVLDSETNVVAGEQEDGRDEPIMLSLTMGPKCKIVIVKKFMNGIHDPETQIQEAMLKYLGEYVVSRNINLEIEWAENAGECCAKIIATAHEWQPDILAIWNMNFDVPKMNWVLTKYGYDLAEVWSDPKIPPVFRYFRYIEGKAQKVTASGKVMALSPAEQWHVVEAPASFYVLDAMCVYLKLRIAKGKEPSYALDAILNKHLGIRKLKFEEADKLKGLAWHRFMQENHKVLYCIYNLFDCISMELLDEKITDLRRVASLMCSHSPWSRFPSQPKRTVDDLYFFVQKHGLVTGTCSREMMDDMDKLVVGLENWIVTLASYLVEDDGIAAIAELPNVRTNMHAHVADLDVEGTYPNEEILMNISKETTAQELSKIQGVSEQTRRAIGINLSGGHVNAVEIVVKGFGAPTMDMLLSAFQSQVNAGSGLPAVGVNSLVLEERQFVGGIDPLSDGFMEDDLITETVDDEDEEALETD